jgi:hypothetical protein
LFDTLRSRPGRFYLPAKISNLHVLAVIDSLSNQVSTEGTSTGKDAADEHHRMADRQPCFVVHRRFPSP